MGYIFRIGALAGILGASGLTPYTSALLAQVDVGCSPTVANPCSGGGGSSSSVNSYQGPSQADIAALQAAQLRQQRINEARAANEQGVTFFNRGDWRSAVASFEAAANKNPSNKTIAENLATARWRLKQAEAELKAQQAVKASAGEMQQVVQNFAKSLDAAPSSGGLDFDGANSSVASSPGAKNGGLDFASSVASPSSPKSGCATPSSTMVVDACNVQSGLTPDVERAINGGYRNAPPGVRERLLKGFQAVAVRDFDVATAWFKDALKLDRTNAGLKGLVEAATSPPVQAGGGRRDLASPKRPSLASLSTGARTMTNEQVMGALDVIIADQLFDEALRSGAAQQLTATDQRPPLDALAALNANASKMTTLEIMAALKEMMAQQALNAAMAPRK